MAFSRRKFGVTRAKIRGTSFSSSISAIDQLSMVAGLVAKESLHTVTPESSDTKLGELGRSSQLAVIVGCRLQHVPAISTTPPQLHRILLAIPSHLIYYPPAKTWDRSCRMLVSCARCRRPELLALDPRLGKGGRICAHGIVETDPMRTWVLMILANDSVHAISPRTITTLLLSCRKAVRGYASSEPSSVFKHQSRWNQTEV